MTDMGWFIFDFFAEKFSLPNARVEKLADLEKTLCKIHSKLMS